MPSPLFFISYTRSDANFALRLAKDIKAAGINLWIDQLDIPAGNRWDTEVQNALKKADGIIVILTAQSVQSNNVLDEISYAFDEGKRVLPVYAGECEIPFRLRRLQHIDFENDYEEGLANLLRSFSGIKNDEAIITPPKDKEPTPVTIEKNDNGKPGNFKKSNIVMILLGVVIAVIGIIFVPRLFKSNAANDTAKLKPDTVVIKKDTPNTVVLSASTTKNKIDTPGIVHTQKKDKIPNNVEPEMTGKDWYAKGLTFFNSNNFTAAIDNFTKAINNNYADEMVYKKRGISYEKMNRPDRAISDFNDAYKKNPDDMDVLVERGNCYLSQKNNDLACNDFSAAALKGNATAATLKGMYCTKKDVVTAEDIAKNITIKVVKAPVNQSQLYNYRYYLDGDKKYLDNIIEVQYQRIDQSAPEYKDDTYFVSTQRNLGFPIQQMQSRDIKYVAVIIVGSDKTVSGKRTLPVIPQFQPVLVGVVSPGILKAKAAVKNSSLIQTKPAATKAPSVKASSVILHKQR